MRSSLGVCILSLLLAAVSGCERPGAEGELCSSPGLTGSDYEGAGGDCAPELICAPDRAPSSAPTGDARCRTLCGEASVACPDGFSCRGVSGAEAHSACQPVAAD